MTKITLTLTQLALVAGVMLAPAAARAQTKTPDIDQHTAGQIIDGCLGYAEDNGIDISIAVFDAGASLKGFARMDGAHNASVDISQWKGRAAASFNKVDTATLATWVGNNPALSFAPRVAPLEGGVPALLPDQGAQIGGVGVSGASPQQDAACARAGLTAAGLDAS